MSIVLFGSDIEESRHSRIVTGIAGEIQNKLRNELETKVGRNRDILFRRLPAYNW